MRPNIYVKIDSYSIGVGSVTYYKTRLLWCRVLLNSIVVVSSYVDAHNLGYGTLFNVIFGVGLLHSTPHRSSNLIALDSSGLKATSWAPNIDPQL